MDHKSEPRFLLNEDSLCYGCPYYCHWTKTRDPVFFEEFDMDIYGGVCDSEVPCMSGAHNLYKKEVV